MPRGYLAIFNIHFCEEAPATDKDINLINFR